MNMFAPQMEAEMHASVLVLSRNSGLLDKVKGALGQVAGLDVSSENLSFADIGEAGGLFMAHKVLVFDLNAEDELELRRITEILSARTEENIVVALTNDDVSLQKARELLDAGVDHVLPYSIKTKNFCNLIAKDLAKTSAADAPAPAKPSGSVIAITKSRGGVGATTVAVNLALGLKKLPSNPRVALVDLDMQFGNAGVFLDLEDNGGLRQLAEAPDLPDPYFVNAIMQEHSSGLAVLCAPASILPLQSLTPELIDHLIKLLTADYDYVVFDLPQALVDWIAPVMSVASHLEVVMDTSVPCVRQVRRLLDFLEYEHFRPQVNLIVNREKKPLIRSESLKQAEEILGRNIEHWIPDAPDAARRAIDLGRPTVAAKPGSGLGRSYTRIAKTLHQSEPQKQKFVKEESV